MWNQKNDQSETERSMEEKRPAVINSRFKRICVLGGNSVGNKDCYRGVAIELGQELVARKLDLSYCGGSFGLMGLVAQEVHRGGQHVLGIIPKPLMNKEIIGETIGEVMVVDHMHQRKAGMARDADCFIALPGGYGTLEMLMEVITWSQLGIHDKPVGLLNVDGYYNSLLTFFEKAVEEGYVYPSQRSIIVTASSAKELIQKLEDYVPGHAGVIDKAKWEADRTAETSSKNDDQTQITR